MIRIKIRTTSKVAIRTRRWTGSMFEGSHLRLRRVAGYAIGLLLAATVGTAAAAAAVTGKKAEFVVDANTGSILHAYKANELRYPASLTKMMTLYLVFEQIENGQLNFNTRITASRRAAGQPPSRIGLKPGTRITVHQAIKALVTKSANDVATAVAEHIAGTESAFARMMTRKARQLGMRRTVFRNASGLPDRGQYTTARDMAQLALRLRDHFPRHYQQFRTRSFKYGGRTYRNHNVLLGRYQGVDGIKTGYTRASGFNLVSSLKRDGRHVVAVVMGGKTGRARNARMRSILKRQFARASTYRTRRPDVRIALRRAPARVAARNAVRRHQAAPRPQVARSQPRRAAPVRSAPQQQFATAAYRRPQLQAARTPSTPAIQIARVRRLDMRNPNQRAQPNRAQFNRPSAPVRTPASPRVVGEYRTAAAAAPQPVTTYYALQSGPVRQTRYQAYNNANRGAARGARPGTLQSQAARLAANQPALIAPAAPRRVYSTNRNSLGGRTTVGGYQIQVGAFFSAAEAHRQLQAISERAGNILAGARPIALRVASGNRELYRARFAGFTSNAATTACTDMRRRRIDCFVTRAN